jgi:hypothetical protein
MSNGRGESRRKPIKGLEEGDGAFGLKLLKISTKDGLKSFNLLLVLNRFHNLSSDGST